MTVSTSFHSVRATFVAGLLVSASTLAAQGAPIVQPGAPGAAPRAITAEQATSLAGRTWTESDIAFMQGMIVHH